MKIANFRPDKRYSNKARDYDAYRPSYPLALVACLRDVAKLAKASTIAELGSGTGIFTRLLLDEGWKVFAVEPNPEMRAISEHALRGREGFIAVEGYAEATTLAASSCHAVVAAQAFHWFDWHRALAEIKRILVPGGSIALVWNELERTIDPFHMGLHSIVQRCPDYAAHSLSDLDDFGDQIRGLFAGWRIQDKRFAYRQQLSLQGLRGRMASNSYWPDQSSTSSPPLVEALSQLFDIHQSGGTVTLEYETRLLVVQ